MSYFDQEEMTRDGHVPSLITSHDGTWSACSCGWITSPQWMMTPAVDAVASHIADVDAGADQ